MANLKLSIYMTAPAVRNFLKDESLLARFIGIAQRLGVSRVYVENYRDGLLLGDDEVDAMVKKLSGSFELAGGTAIGTWGKGWFSYEDYGFRVACISDDGNKSLIAEAMRRLASHFDEILIDDFWAQWCHSDRDVELFNSMYGLNLTRESLMDAMRRGDKRILTLWAGYSTKMLSEVSREFVVKPAREVNRNIKVNLKVAEWREDFPHRGLALSEMANIFDGIYVGTESREGTEQYGSLFIVDYVRAIVGDKLKGAWFDTFNGIFSWVTIDVGIYLRQLWYTALSTIGEIVLFDAWSLTLSSRERHVDALSSDLPMAKAMFNEQSEAKLGLLAPASQATGMVFDRYIHDYLGMIAVPLRPANISQVKRGDYVIVTEHVVDSIDLARLVNNGVNLVVTSGASELIASGALGEFGLRLLGLSRNDPMIAPTMDALYFKQYAKPIDIGVEPHEYTIHSYTHRRQGAFPIGPILNVERGKVILSVSDGSGEYPVAYYNELGNSRIYVMNVTKYGPYLKEYYPEVARRVIRDVAMEYIGLRLDALGSMTFNISLIPYANGNVAIYNANNHPVKAVLNVDTGRFGKVGGVNVAGGRGSVDNVEYGDVVRVYVTIDANSPLMLRLRAG